MRESAVPTAMMAPGRARLWVATSTVRVDERAVALMGRATLVSSLCAQVMPDIGATLQEARMRARIDISEVEAATKIRAKYLRAIENEEWDMLPGPTFVKSFLRTYAEYLGIDGKLLVEEYKLRYEPPPSDTELQSLGPPVGPRRPRAPRPPRFSRGWIIGLSILGLIVLLVILGSIGGGNDDTPVATRPTATTPAKPKPKPRPAPTVARLTLTPTGEVYV